MTHQGMVWKEKSVPCSSQLKEESIRMVFFIFLFWFFILSIYSPTWVSKTLPQKSLFARTNRIPKRMLRVTIINWVIHKTAILKLAVFIFRRWSSLVILLRISFLIFAFLCKQSVIDWQLKYFLSIIHDSFLFIALLLFSFHEKFFCLSQ